MGANPPIFDPNTLSDVVPTPFVTSWIGRARPGDMHDPNPARRASAWANWMVSSMTPLTGSADRPYIALKLPGKFYDPKGTGPTVPPHVEIPSHWFEKADSTFPDRVSQAGNGLLFSWWLVPEVLAVKRALFSVPRRSTAELTDLLNDRRPGLVSSLTTLTNAASNHWTAVEEHLVTDPAKISELATADFTQAQVAQYWPAAGEVNLRIEFDRILRDSAKGWASRRVGVWRLVGNTGGGDFVLGVVTPRLTRSSLFSDPLFKPTEESSAACLVRGLVLRRLLASFAPNKSGEQVSNMSATPQKLSAGLRAVVAHVGEKLPQASAKAAVKFLNTYPDSDTAWRALDHWASARSNDGATKHAVLTVSEDGFKAAHKSALRALRRAEDPERDDINIILPLAWDDKNRVVRVTFASAND